MPYLRGRLVCWAGGKLFPRLDIAAVAVTATVTGAHLVSALHVFRVLEI